MKFGFYPFGTLNSEEKEMHIMKLDCVGYQKRRNANFNIVMIGKENLTCSKRLFYSFLFS
jgi:hypothetical protein